MSDKLSLGVHTFPAPGITLTYTVRGAGPLLFIQAAGWGIGSRYLQIGLVPLEAHFKLVFIEPRGSCGSARPENEEDMADIDMAGDMEQLRLYLGQDQIDLLGHSNGGSIALLYAEQFPDSVRKVIILTHWLDGFPDTETRTAFMEARRNDPKYAKAISIMESSFKPKTEEEFYQNLVDKLCYYVFDVEKHYPIFVEAMGRPSWWVNKATGAANSKKGFNLWQDLYKVKAKTLALGCSEDPICTANMSRETAKGIEGAELFVIDECGHFPWIEKPDEFFPEVIRFFSA